MILKQFKLITLPQITLPHFSLVQPNNPNNRSSDMFRRQIAK